MKHFILVLVSLFAFTVESFCQIPGYREDTYIPTFDLNFLILKSSNNPDKEFEFLNTAMLDFLEDFPSPDKNEDYYFEFDEVMARLIVYGENDLFFLEGSLHGLQLKDPKFSIGNGEHFIKVGDHYSSVKYLFPSYENEIESDENENAQKIFIPLSNGEMVLDDGLLILFDLASGKITEILL
jgi:hypothetical protein